MPCRMINGEKLLEKMPFHALTGEDMAVDMILYEILHLLVDSLEGDTGQINLLPRGGRVEKVCIIKNGRPWLKKGMGLHLFDPHKGYTGQVMGTGESILVKDIWADGTQKDPNPFLELIPTLNKRYVKEIKTPVGSIIIAPIKREGDIFCTIEVGRYREQRPFSEKEKELVDGFALKYGAMIMDYILDVKNRIAINTAHKKLLSLGRLIASNKPVDYRDAVGAYLNLSGADIGFVFLKTGDMSNNHYRALVWEDEEIREIMIEGFVPSYDSVLRDNTEVVFPVEGKADDPRLRRFERRIVKFSGLEKRDREFILKCVGAIQSYVAYPLHLLGQDLGAIVLGSRRPGFWPFLHLNPFLALYNTLLKSFLLNERVIHQLSEMSLKIHNPGFYCLGLLKGKLASEYPQVFQDPEVERPLTALQNLLNELHGQGIVLRSRAKNVRLLKWLKAFINQKKATMPGLEIILETHDRTLESCLVRASEEQLETVFENLFCNSRRAIGERRRKDPALIGAILISARTQKERIKIRFQDNGLPYPTVSGRGILQVKNEMKDLGGGMRRHEKPYRVFLDFPHTY